MGWLERIVSFLTGNKEGKLWYYHAYIGKFCLEYPGKVEGNRSGEGITQSEMKRIGTVMARRRALASARLWPGMIGR